MKEVIIYSTQVCPYCKRAKDYLSGQSINYKEVDLGGNETLRNEMINKYQWQTVPMIFIGDEFIGGYDDLMNLAAENRLLEKINA